jgi:AraC-like DNA-binding protein
MDEPLFAQEVCTNAIPEEVTRVSRLSKLGFINTRRTHLPVRRRIRSRGVPTALAGHPVFCTEDPSEAGDLVGKVLGPTTLRPTNYDPALFEASLHAVRLRDVSLAYLDFHIGVAIDVPSTGDHYTVHMPTTGQTHCRYNGAAFEVATYQGLVVNPGTHLHLQLGDDTPQLLVRIERDALERQLARMLGRSVDRTVTFEPLLDLTSDEAVRWHGAIQLLSSEVMTVDSLIQKGLGAGPIEDLIISSLLLVQASNVRDELVRSAGRSGRRSVRLSIDYIERNLAHPLTLQDIAENTHMSARSIQQGFRDDLGTTPMAYVRERRLERARADLADAVPSDGVTVTDIAERWGFSHLGNFAVTYRKRFGESPSETLRR